MCVLQLLNLVYTNSGMNGSYTCTNSGMIIMLGYIFHSFIQQGFCTFAFFCNRHYFVMTISN